jgi:hypothetical protein
MLDKEAISQSRKLSELSNNTGRLIYTWLLAHLDSEGRFSADPAIIKGNVFPRIRLMTKSKIEKSLIEMSNIGLIILYQVDSDKYLQYTKFREYQNLSKNKEAPSKIPEPTEKNIYSGINQSKSDLVALSEVKLREEKLREEKIDKVNYAEFVLLTPEEHQKLISKYGSTPMQEMIEKLNNHKGSKGKEYKSDYRAILSWVVEWYEQKTGKKFGDKKDYEVKGKLVIDEKGNEYFKETK